jgi:hypothetical protein
VSFDCPVEGCAATQPFKSFAGLGKHMSSQHGISAKAWKASGAPLSTSPVPAPTRARVSFTVPTVEAVRCDGCAKLELFDRDNFTWSRVVVSPPGFDDITLLFHSPACQKMNFNRRLDERMKKLADDAR